MSIMSISSTDITCTVHNWKVFSCLVTGTPSLLRLGCFCPLILKSDLIYIFLDVLCLIVCYSYTVACSGFLSFFIYFCILPTKLSYLTENRVVNVRNCIGLKS